MTNPVIENIRARRSIRFYEKTAVPAEAIETILECGMLSPTALGLQSWHFTVVRDRALLDEISEANRQLMLQSGDPAEIEKANEPGFDNFRHAPMAIIISGDTKSKWYVADCANAATTMALTAESLGLSTCYIASFRRVLAAPQGAELLARLGLPENYDPLFALSIGYKAEEPHPRKPRKENTVNYIG